MSADSGIQTFRGSGGLWEGYDVMEVATPEAWARNPALVLDFYNQRRKNVLTVEPNRGHEILKELEAHFLVTVVTQNIDNLHERAGSSHILHLHGEITKGRSTVDENLIFELEKDTIEMGDLCPRGSQVRPHIVWFGEAVPMLEDAVREVLQADILLVVGTSMAVYPAASLTQYAPVGCPVYLVDPNPGHSASSHFTHIVANAEEGLEEFRNRVIKT